jgi:hypothetical protein
LISSGHSGPADIYYNNWLEVLVVPNISGNTVDFINLPVPVSLASCDFSDENYGDGDGILEGGEDIELTFSFENTRPDSMNNTSVKVYCQDISLIITNDSLGFGDLAPEEVADNASSPMQFIIPTDYIPRIDSFYFEINYSFMGREKTDSLVIMQSVGFPDILLVDDFAGDSISDYYTQTLEELFISHNLWDIQTMGTPLSDDLNQYSVVIWFTGDTGADSINSEKLLNLQEYLDNGGNLFVTGQGIAASIDSLDVGFLNNYLKCEHVSPYYMVLLNTVSSAQVFNDSDTLMIWGGDGASSSIIYLLLIVPQYRLMVTIIWCFSDLVLKRYAATIAGF